MSTSQLPSFRQLMTFRLHMVARLSEGISEEYYRRQFDLTLPQCRVIGITAGYGTVPFKQMAQEANLEKSYASRVVATLVDRELIAKSDNPADSRSVLLTLTEGGRTVHRDLYAAAVRLNDRLMARFSKTEVRGLLASLSMLEEQLRAIGGSLDTELAGDASSPDRASQPATIPLDREMAARLHAMLGRYLAD